MRIDSIAQLTELKSINLRSNVIESVKGIEELKNITNLELSIIESREGNASRT